MTARSTATPSAAALDRRRRLFWLAPPLLWFLVFLVIPYGVMLYFSLGHMDYVTFVPGASIGNYIHLFMVKPYSGVMLKSATIGLATAVFATLLAYPVAMTLAFYIRREWARSLCYLMIILPWWASYLVKAYAWKTILGSGGLLNGVLMRLGVVDAPVAAFLYNDFSVVLALTYIFTPFAVLSIYAQLEKIPGSLIEAARNLGASDVDIFRRVILPISLPGVLAGGVLIFALGFGDFIAPALLGGPESLMISSLIINLLGVANDKTLAGAIGVTIIVIASILLTVVNRLENRSRVRI